MHAAIDFLAPAYCRHCGALVDGDIWYPLLCRECAAVFPWHDAAVDVPAPVARGWALALFEGPARRLLIDLKFAGVLRAGYALGGQMARAPGAGEVILAGADVVVPVPLHPWRRWRRGHNQAAVLAKALCRQRRDLTLLPALRRRRATAPQVGKQRHERLRNVAGAFAVRQRQREMLAGRTIVLVDDVVTTGSTAAAATRALVEAGAAEVRVYAAAWSD